MNNPITPRLLPPERLAEIEKLFSDDLIGKGFLDIYFVRDLLGHIAALERDRQRLDWLERDVFRCRKANPDGGGTILHITIPDECDFRAAIDAAMRGGKETN